MSMKPYTVTCLGKVSAVAFVALCAVAAQANTTWYRNANMNSSSANYLKQLSFWKDASGKEGTGSVSATDDLISNGRFSGNNPTRIRVPGLNFAGNSLQIGDDTNPCELVHDNANNSTMAFVGDGLKLKSGSWWFNGNNDFTLSGPVMVLSTGTPFAFYYGQDQYSNHTAKITGALTGAEGTKLRCGMMSGGTAARNSTYQFSDIDGFAGELIVSPASTKGGFEGNIGKEFGSRVRIPAGTASACTLTVEGGGVIQVSTAAGVATVGNASFAAGSRLEVSCSATTAATLRVSGSCTVAPGTQVAIGTMGLTLYGTRRVPLLTAPAASSSFTEDDFTLVKFAGGENSTAALAVDVTETERTLYAVPDEAHENALWQMPETRSTISTNWFSDLKWWVDMNGEAGPAGTPLPPTDDFLLANSRRIRSHSMAFTGHSLQLGDASGYGEIVHDQRAGIHDFSFGDGDGLKLYDGHWWVNIGPGAHSTYSGPVRVLPGSTRVPAFAFSQSQYSNGVVKITGPLSGESKARLRLGVHDLQAASSAPNATFELHDMSAYHGELIVDGATARSLPDYSTCLRLSTNGVSDCTVTLAANKGFVSTVWSNGTATVGKLVFNAGTGILLNGADAGIGHVRVTDALTAPASGKIAVVWNNFFCGGSTNRLPLLTWPAATALTEDDFELRTFRNHNLGLSLSVEPEGAVRTLYVNFTPMVRQVLSIEGSNVRDTFLASSMTNAACWSDGQLPHPGATYNSSMTLIAPYNGTGDEDLAFPGDGLYLTGGNFFTALRSYVVPTIVCDGSTLCTTMYRPTECVLTLTATNGFVFQNNVVLRTHMGNTFVLDGNITGSGIICLNGNGPTGNPAAIYELNGDNSGYTGRILVDQTEKRSQYTSFDAKFTTLQVNDGSNLGGAMEAFDACALKLTFMARLSVTNTASPVTLAAGLNRGVCIEGVGRFHAVRDAKLVVDQPLLLDGVMWKEGPGTLALGGPTSLVREPAAGSNAFIVAEGTVSVKNAYALDGLATVLSNNTSLVLAYDPNNADLVRYGIRATGVAAPFTLASGLKGRLPIAVDRGSLPPLAPAEVLTNAIVTVEGAAAEGVRAMLPPTRRLWRGTSGKRLETTNGDGTVTFAYEVANTGMLMIVR